MTNCAIETVVTPSSTDSSSTKETSSSTTPSPIASKTSTHEPGNQTEEPSLIFRPEPDVTVKSRDGGTVYVHSALLRNRSQVFAAMDFEGKVVTSTDHAFEELKLFFEALYSLCPVKLLTCSNVVRVARLGT